MGSDFYAPRSLVIDTRGIYYDATRVSDLEVLLETAAVDDVLRYRAAAVRERLVRSKISKYNVGSAELPVLNLRRKRTLQKYRDASAQAARSRRKPSTCARESFVRVARYSLSQSTTFRVGSKPFIRISRRG